MSVLPLTALILLGVLLPCGHAQRFLAVQNGQLRLNGEKVFMSGMNIAWHQFGNDFGNGRYDCCTGAQLEDYLRRISAAGGNSIRIWLHCAGESTPRFDGAGYVSGTDGSNTLIRDLQRFLDVAYNNNILVFIVLWNGATQPSGRMLDLLSDVSKLYSYVDNALIPMVNGLKDKVALGGWEVMNEPEGLVSAGQTNSNNCFDTRPLTGSGAGWVNTFIPMQNLLRFINVQNAAIKQADPKAVTTLGSWSERSQTDRYGYRNYYTDSCLIAAGGNAQGVIDFFQMHTYSWEGQYSTTSPMRVSNAEFGLNKPNVVGELSQDGGDGRDITVMFDWAYNQGYAGIWTWQANGGGYHSDDFNTQARGLQFIRNRNNQNLGGRVAINLQ